ncbi:MAG: hypothetical protein P8Y65_03970 [Campylobacterales bacterium]|jgi:hypothetical protein
MKSEKYSNLDDALPGLTCVLKDAIQAEMLEIKKVDKMCSKFLKAQQEHPVLSDAEFVVYSPYVRKADHPFEHFVFLDRSGKSLCHISGTEMELYGLLDPCTNLLTADDSGPKRSKNEMPSSL